MLIKVKVKNIDQYEEGDYVYVIEPLDEDDGENREHVGLVKEINEGILSIDLYKYNYISSRDVFIYQKYNNPATIIEK